MEKTSENGKISLWNPDVAGVWSLIFTPIFGSIILLKNWETIGEQESISKAKKWLYIRIALFFVSIFIKMAGFVYILIWYFSWQRHQTQYIKQTYHDYDKKSWWKPFLFGILSYIVLVIVFTIIGFTLALLKG